VIGCPVRLSDSPVTARRAPLKGEHTEDVLRSLAGYTPEEIQQLKEKQVI
jgi:crotonobetainyl-CoA:carnitine CoA-transferase CaiB-like acyl-CoA transferase